MFCGRLHNTMKDKDRKSNISESELSQVSGGTTPALNDSTNPGRCYFTIKPGAVPKVHKDVYSLECGSNCWGCACHRKEWCVDRMHQIGPGTNRLLPSDKANHKNKLPGNNYNT